jgi:6-pyruvoyltetrahydropterin/6-carboxytetrahydropterin synthase
MLKIGPRREAAAGLGSAMALLVTRRATFAAAHVLRRPEWSERRNREVFGACAGEHGHNYVLEVSVSGTLDPATGMVINLKSLDQSIREAVIDHVDHRHLNHDVPFLEGVVPTAENLALAFWKQLDANLSGARLERLRLVESENNSVEVSR